MVLKSSLPQNDTLRVRSYEAFRRGMNKVRHSYDAGHQRAWRDIRDLVVSSGSRSAYAGEIERLLMERGAIEQRAIEQRATPAAVHSNTFMNNLSVKYANEEYISEELLPTVPVDNLSNEYAIYSKRDNLAVPNASMKGRSTPNEIFDNREVGSYSCDPFGLTKSLERKTIDNQDKVFDEMMNLSLQVSEVLALEREKRGMAILTTAANFGSNTAAIAGGSEWNTAGGGDPINAIRTARHNLWRGSGTSRILAYCPINVYLALSTNPKILDTTKYTSAGTVPRQVLASLFEVDDLLIAKAWEDTANEGQAASYARITTAKVFGLVRVAEDPNLNNAAFGYNLRFKGEINNRTWLEENQGTRGTYKNQQTCDETFKVIAPDTGYLLTGVLT